MLEAKRDELTRRHTGLVQCVSLRAAQLCFRRRLPIMYLRLPSRWWCRMVLKLLRPDGTCTLFQLTHQFRMPTQP